MTRSLDHQIANNRVDFLCVGCQKGGTTSLRAYLRSHPEIDMPVNEVHYFDDESQDWNCPYPLYYHNCFESLKPSTNLGTAFSDLKSRLIKRGEVTPYYIYWEPCAERIYSYNPRMKIIILLRDPMARAYSHWQMEVSKSREHLPFSECIRAERGRLTKYPPFYQHRVCSYIDRGRYYKQIKRFLEYFDKRQVLILKSEDFFQYPLIALGRICDFIGISPYAGVEIIHQRQGLYKNPIHSSDWQFVYEQLACQIESLECLLGWDCSSWKIP